jgi:hypothetical protein
LRWRNQHIKLLLTDTIYSYPRNQSDGLSLLSLSSTSHKFPYSNTLPQSHVFVPPGNVHLQQCPASHLVNLEFACFCNKNLMRTKMPLHV